MPVFISWTHLVPGSESIPRWHYYATYQDAYPLPKQNDMLGPWGKLAIYSSLDVTKGFSGSTSHLTEGMSN